MDESTAFFDLAAEGFFAGFIVARAVEDDLSAVGAGSGYFDEGRGEGHDDLGTDAESGGVEGYSLGVVAGAGGDNSLFTLGFGQGKELVEGSTFLERAGALQVFKLEVERKRNQLREMVGELAGRHVDRIADAGAGGLNAG